MMADENPLFSHPFFTEPLLSKPSGEDARSLEERLDSASADLPPPPTMREYVSDVGQSMAAGAGRGLVGTVKGGLGSVESFFGQDVPELARQGYLAAQEKLDIISPAERERRAAQPLYEGQTPEQQAGRAAPFTELPTYKGVTEDLKKSTEARSFPFMSYEPQTGPGKVAGTAAEYAMQGLPGGVRGTAGRLITGAGAGAGTGLAEISATDPEDNTFRTVVYALGGAGAGALGHSLASKIVGGVRTLVAPGSVAEKELAAMIAQDIRRGQSAMTVDQFSEAASRGVPVSIMDLAGPDTRKRMGAYITKTPSLEEEGSAFNAFLRDRAEESGNRIASNVDSVFGRPVNAPASAEMADIIGKQQRDEVYGLLRDPSNVAAQSIDQSAFSGLFDRPIFQKAMKDAEVSAKNLPEYDIRPPRKVGERPARGTGVLDENGNEIVQPAAPGRMVNGNLAYWDQVKRELDSYIKKAQPGGSNAGDTEVLNAARLAKGELLKTLDNVPGYAKARGVAVETFGASDAPEAGYKFFNNMNDFRRADVVRAFGQMTDGQKELFREGFAHRIGEMARNGQIDSLANKFSTPAFKDRAILVLGPEKFADIQATVASESILSKAKQLRFLEQPPGVKEASLKGAMAGAAGDMLLFGNQMGASPEQIMKIVGAAVAGAAGKVGLNSMERRIAAKIVPLATSTDPADIKELAKLIKASPTTGQVLDKIRTSLTTAVTAAQDKEQTGQRAFGGRVGRATGGRVGVDVEADALVRAAERAKKSFNKTTEPLLNAPDNHIAKALEVANKAI